MIKYAFNFIIFVFIKIFAFMTKYDFESRMSFDSVNSIEKSTRERILRTRDVDMTKKMKEIIEFTKKKLVKVKENQKINANKKRASALDYKENELV
jgi:hypothetical protein